MQDYDNDDLEVDDEDSDSELALGGDYNDDLEADDSSPMSPKNLKIAGAVLAIVAIVAVAFQFNVIDVGPSGKVMIDAYTDIAEGKTPDKDKGEDEKKSSKKPKKNSKGARAGYNPRQWYVLEQAAEGNYPGSFDDFEEIEVTGKKGTVVRFWASKRGFCLGNSSDCVEIPLDARFSQAVAEVLGYHLPTYWMVDQIYLKAKKNDGKVKFYLYCEIAGSLGEENCNPNKIDGKKSMSPRFIRERNELTQKWRDMKKNDISDTQLMGGYFKSVIHPVPTGKRGFFKNLFARLTGKGYSRIGNLAIYGGYNDAGDPIQGIGQVHGKIFFDYSQGLRLVKWEMEVDGETMTMDEFFFHPKLWAEFGFQRQHVKERAYKYFPELKKFVEEHK